MATRDVDIAIRYILQTVDRGLKQGIGLTADMAKVTRDSTKALVDSDAAWRTSSTVVAQASAKIGGSVAAQVKEYDKAALAVKAAADAQARASKVWVGSAADATKASQRVAADAAQTAKVVTDSSARQASALRAQGEAWALSAGKASKASVASGLASDAAAAASLRGARAVAVHDSSLTKLSSGLSKSGQAVQNFGSKTKAAGAAVASIGNPLAAVAAGSVYLQMKFQGAMEQVRTQAGYSQKSVDTLSKQVLAAAPSLAQAPAALAAGLYHVASVGIPASKAMDVVKAAAIGANISGASFDDTANALVTTMKNFPHTAGGAKAAMAELNAIVGAGNMHMQDLVTHLGQVVPIGQTFGLSLTQIGGALDVMTGHGMAAAQSTTALRMTIAKMGAPGSPTSAAVGVLKSLGLTSTQLALDMHKPDGLQVALTDLKTHLDSLGNSTADNVKKAQDLSQVFGGGKTAAGIMLLENHLSDLNATYKRLPQGAAALKSLTASQDAWDKTTQGQVDHVKAALETTGIQVGQSLVPIVVPALKEIGGAVTSLAHGFSGLPKPVKDVALGLAAVSIVAGPILKVFSGLTTIVGGTMRMLGRLVGHFAPVDAELSAQEKATLALQASTDALAAANDRLAASFDAVAGSARAAATGEVLAKDAGGLGGMPGIAGGVSAAERGAVPGALMTESELAAARLAAGGELGTIAPTAAGGSILAGGAGEAAALTAGGGAMALTARGGSILAGGAGAAEAGLAAAAPAAAAAETGLLGSLLGKAGLMSVLTKVGPALGMAAKGGMFGLMGNQLGGMLGGVIGGKTGSGWGSAIGTGAGLGMAVGPEGALAGAAIGAGVHGLISLFGGGGGSLTDVTQKLQAEMASAAKAGNAAKLSQLADQAAGAATKLHDAGISAGDLSKLATAAGKTAAAIATARGGAAVSGLQASIAGSKFKPSSAQIGQATIAQLKGLGQQAQDAGAQAMVRFTAGLEYNKQLPIGSTDALIAQLETRYGPQLGAYLKNASASTMESLAVQIRQSKVVPTVQAQVAAMHKEWGLMIPDAQVTGENVQQVMQSNMAALEQIVKTSTGRQRQDALTALQQMTADEQKYLGLSNSQWKTWSSTLTKALPAISNVTNAVSALFSVASQTTPTGGGHSTKVKSLLGGWAAGGYVPGNPHMDGTLIAAAGNEFVMTGHGQSMMEAHAPGLLGMIDQQQLPHFAAGGFTSDVRKRKAAKPAAGAGGLPLQWVRTGATIDTAAGYGISEGAFASRQAGGASNYHAGFSFAELLEAGANAGRRPDLTALLGLPRTTATGMAFGTELYFRSVGGTRVAKGAKSDVGSGQPSTHFTTDLHQGLASAIGWNLGKGDVEVAASKGVTGGSTGYSVTNLVPAGHAISGAFDLGYNYGLDPTVSGVTSPAKMLAQATLAAQLKAVTKHVSTASAGGSAGGSGTLGKIVAQANAIAAHNYNYEWGGGHNSSFTPSAASPPGINGSGPGIGYDCSGATSAVLHAGGLLSSPLVASQFMSWGSPGAGQSVSIYASPSHVFSKLGGRYFGTSGQNHGGGANWIPSFPESMPALRHPPGLRGGGPVSRRFPGLPKAERARQRANPFAILPGLQAGGFTSNLTRASAPVHHAARPPRVHIHTPRPRTGTSGVKVAAPLLPANLTYTALTSEAQILATIPAQALTLGVKTTRAAAVNASRALQAVATDHTNKSIAAAFAGLARTLGNVSRVSYGHLQSIATGLKTEISKLAKHPGIGQEQTRLRAALSLVDYQMGQRVGALVRGAVNQSAALGQANTELTRLLERTGISSTSAQGTAMFAQLQDQSVKVLRSTVAQLQVAYKAAKKAGDSKAIADISGKLQTALDNLDQGIADQIQAWRNMVEAAAQGVVDSATHTVTMAQTGEANLGISQQLAGTAGTPGAGQQTAAYIKTQVLPALQGELSALQGQEAAAVSVGDTTLATQIAEAIASTQGNILQAQLDAQNAIAQNTAQTATNTQALTGALGVSFNSQQFSDLAGITNGA